ncbi:hypothetical protein H0H81_006524 [Sphagnurus paluster]|uniref:G domain-containing protein n=1 Tax=Sphagnurus paluster TaxID=117069 RepID=A0A9P7KIW4_9AGAR|nr:hypothetical protein H0H81_006524 [Sphagnurus paluster]
MGKSTSETTSQFESRPDDLVIPIFGLAGAGKSTFINKLCNEDVAYVNDDLDTGTTEVCPYIYHHPNSQRRIVIVDTPGFQLVKSEDDQILKKVSSWLQASYNSKIEVIAGIIYLHDISQSRKSGDARNTCTTFKILDKRNATDNVVLVTSKWNDLTRPAQTQREQELGTQHWNDFIQKGDKIHRFEPWVAESAARIVDALLAKVLR